MKVSFKVPAFSYPKRLITGISFLLVLVLGCKGPSAVSKETPTTPEEFVIAFGSCNRVDRPNHFWESIRLKKTGSLDMGW